jgi:inner membrane protease ATP23
MDALQKCRAQTAASLRSSPRISVLLGKLSALGCATTADSIVCEDVFGSARVGGAFDSSTSQIIMNPRVPASLAGQADWTRAITHELVHAYDACRVQLEPDNCAHLACTEIRASNLSGECDFGAEAGRAPLQLAAGGLGGAQQRCVRRRAELSVSGFPPCSREPDDAAKTVAAAWPLCYRDTAPFASN